MLSRLPIMRCSFSFAVLGASLSLAFGCSLPGRNIALGTSAPRVAIPHPHEQRPATREATASFRMTLAGEPWDSLGKAPLEVSAAAIASPATEEFRPWGTAPGSRIITMTAKRPDDGRTLIVQVALPASSTHAGDPVSAFAEYRTTQGTVWRTPDTSPNCRVLLTRLERDERGVEAKISIAFELELNTPGAPRPLKVNGAFDDVAVSAED